MIKPLLSRGLSVEVAGIEPATLRILPVLVRSINGL
jgi:hypothetical protein